MIVATLVATFVDVRSVPDLHIADSGWVIFAAIFSAAAAITTATMALYTRNLARETLDNVRAARENMAAEERRHMDRFLPHLALEVRDEPYRELERRPSNGGGASSVSYVPRTVAVLVRNIGTGFAQNIISEDQNITTETVGKFDPPLALGSATRRG